MTTEAKHRRRDALAQQIERERLELKNAPKINVITDAVLRCGGCGQVFDQLYELPAPAHPDQKLEGRKMCIGCHPDLRHKHWEV